MIYNDEIVKYFKSCNHINDVLGKATIIKNTDAILDDYCMICMDKYKAREYKRIIPKCNHFFHKKCIDKWLKKKATCPVCRCDLLETNGTILDSSYSIDIPLTYNLSGSSINESSEMSVETSVDASLDSSVGTPNGSPDNA